MIFKMNKVEAENYIYKSYLKANKFLEYNLADSQKRNPIFSYQLIRNLCETPCVIVTGSKGKGSVASMISQIMQTKLKIGLMTSPHLIDFCERFRINGQQISDKDFVENVEFVSPFFDEIDDKIPNNKYISPIGIQTAIALNYFNKSRTQFNVFECGKGAKYDDVNNILHEYAVINSVFLEHTRELGKTLEEIASDKAHVITGEQKCVYVAEQSPEVLQVIEDRAQTYKVPIKIYGKDFKSENIQYTNIGMRFDVVIGNTRYKDLIIPLLGEHQAKNCALAMALCKDVLKELDLTSIRKMLSDINWPGRMEILSSTPFILLDACINSESAKNVKQTLKYLQINNVSLIIGIPDDKDYIGVAQIMKDVTSSIILTQSQNPHYVFTQKQQSVLLEKGINTQWTSNVMDAIALAKQTKSPIIILGTTSVVSEVKNIYSI